MEELKVYNIEEISKILGVGKKAIYASIKSGKLKATKVGREWRITESAFLEFMKMDEE